MITEITNMIIKTGITMFLSSLGVSAIITIVKRGDD